MKIEKIKLDKLVENEENIRIHTNTQIKQFKRSVEKFGQVRPVIVDGSNKIIAGHGLYLTLKELGWEEVFIYRIDKLTKAQARRLMLADNKIYELGMSNKEAFLKAFEDIGVETGVYDIPGFDEDVLNGLRASVNDLLGFDDEKKNDDESVGKESVVVKAGSNIKFDDLNRPFIICSGCKKTIWL